MNIAIGCDHGGYELKEALKKMILDAGLKLDDKGCFNSESVDYPDYAAAVAQDVADGVADRGIVICTTGIGVSVVANKFPRVRAALCSNVKLAELARTHNNANVLALGAQFTEVNEAYEIVKTFLDEGFDDGGRHARRVEKVREITKRMDDSLSIYDTDTEIYAAVMAEANRQNENLELIASENIASRAVRDAMGSVLTNKYAEGYPSKRWYNGCEFVDDAERLAIDRAKELFGAEHANVQPHSGSSANMAVYFACLKPGDTIMAMSLADGGHLTHGHPMNFSGKLYNIVPYGVTKETEMIDYDEIQRLAEESRPKLLVAGASAYSRIIDFKRLRHIADSVGAYLMVDMAHIAGLVAAGCHPSPVPYCEFVTTTTHKTLRGPRGGMVLCQERFAADIDKTVFPGLQGGPLEHVIAAKAICFHEAMQPEFTAYQEQVVKNAKALAEALQKSGLRLVSGGTDNHLMLVDLSPAGVTGKAAATALDLASITVNKNAIPFDTKSPFVTSGVRLGTPAITTRGMKEEQMVEIAGYITDTIKEIDNEKAIAEIRKKVLALTAQYPMP